MEMADAEATKQATSQVIVEASKAMVLAIRGEGICQNIHAKQSGVSETLEA